VAIINLHGDTKYLAVGCSAVLVRDSFKVFVVADVIALTEALFVFAKVLLPSEKDIKAGFARPACERASFSHPRHEISRSHWVIAYDHDGVPGKSCHGFVLGYALQEA
jgi:hypothetical protein